MKAGAGTISDYLASHIAHTMLSKHGCSGLLAE